MFTSKISANPKFILYAAIIFSTAILIVHSNLVFADGIVFQDDFKNSPVGQKAQRTKTAPWQAKCSGNCPIVSAEQSRIGNKSLRTHLDRNKSQRSYRTEMVLAGDVNSKVRQGEHWWYAFSVYVPKNHIPDALSHDTVAQWHSTPDHHLGETFGGLGGPVLSLRVDNKSWALNNSWNPNKIGSGDDPEFDAVRLKLGPYKAGTWTDWVFHVKWSWKNDGILEVWKDGVQVVNRHGPNNYNDDKGPYMKVGLYKTAWRGGRGDPKVKTRTFFHDGFVVATGANVRYSDVALNDGRASPEGRETISPPEDLRISSSSK